MGNKIYLTLGRIMLIFLCVKFVMPLIFFINLCVKFVIPLIFTEVQPKEIKLFNRSNSKSFMYRWFIQVAMKHWMVTQQGHLIFVIFINFIIFCCSKYCGAMIISWKICSWFNEQIVRGKSHRSLHKYHSLCACQVFEWEGFSFVITCETHGTTDLCFPWWPQRAQWPQGA